MTICFCKEDDSILQVRGGVGVGKGWGWSQA